MRSYYVHIPQLDLNDKQRQLLYKRYLSYKKQNKGYNKNTYDHFTTLHTNIDVLKGIYSDTALKTIEELCKDFPKDDKFKRESSYEFLTTTGEVKIHRDPVRLAVLTIPIKHENSQLEFWNENETRIITQLDYGNKTYIMKTRTPHRVTTSSKDRVFWQASIFIKDYKLVMTEYLQGKLF